jgi:hypothetical protein
MQGNERRGGAGVQPAIRESAVGGQEVRDRVLAADEAARQANVIQIPPRVLQNRLDYWLR